MKPAAIYAVYAKAVRDAFQIAVPAEVLQPRSTWADPAAYDAQARKLARMFAENFRTFADGVSPEILAAAPRIE